MATVAPQSRFGECRAGVVDLAFRFIWLVERESGRWSRRLAIAVAN
jgi:hypothetical protein